MNILCVCDHGEVRSVAMAIVLREHGHFSVAGTYDNYFSHIQGDSMRKFTALFDKVIFMQEGGTHSVGRDEWGDPHHPELRMKCVELMQKLKL